MSLDIRRDAAAFYDLSDFPDDIPFYRDLIKHPSARVLELGCGTGRVMVGLYDACGYVCGIDKSQAMLDVCRDKLGSAGMQTDKTRVEMASIANFSLGESFDLIIAPFRVLQNLESDEEVDGLSCCIRDHLQPDGSCVLNVFQPKYERHELADRWPTTEETFGWERLLDGERIVCTDSRRDMDADRLVLYPELIYRRYVGDKVDAETVLRIPMRVYYPEDLESVVTKHGFEVQNRWGGYDGEPYGAGPELVVEFGVGA